MNYKFTPINFDAVEELISQLPRRNQQVGFVVSVFLLSQARRQSEIYQGLELSRGQACISRREIPKKIPVSIQEFRTILNRLEEVKFLTRFLTHQNLILSICDFDSYVIDQKESNPVSNPPLTHSSSDARAEMGKEPHPSSSQRACAREEGVEIGSEKTRTARDDFETDMVEYWTNHIAPELPIPWPQFDFWRKHNSEEVILCATLHMISTGKSVKDPLAYLPSLFPDARQNKLSTQRSHTLCLTDSRYQVQSDTSDSLDDLLSGKEKTYVAP